MVDVTTEPMEEALMEVMERNIQKREKERGGL